MPHLIRIGPQKSTPLRLSGRSIAIRSLGNGAIKGNDEVSLNLKQTLHLRTVFQAMSRPLNGQYRVCKLVMKACSPACRRRKYS